MGFAHNIAIRAPFECVYRYIDPHPIPFSCNADTGHLSEMYISIDASYIFHFEYRSYLMPHMCLQSISIDDGDPP